MLTIRSRQGQATPVQLAPIRKNPLFSGLSSIGGNAGESNPPGKASQHPTTVLKTAQPTRTDALPLPNLVVADADHKC